MEKIEDEDSDESDLKSESELAQLDKQKQEAKLQAERELAELDKQKQEAKLQAERELAELEKQKQAKLQAERELAELDKQKQEAKLQAEAEKKTMNQPVSTSGEKNDELSVILSKVKTPEQAQIKVDEVQQAINLYLTVKQSISKRKLSKKDKILATVDKEIKRLNTLKISLQDMLTSRYSTPIKPTNANLSTSSFRAAETFPKRCHTMYQVLKKLVKC